MLAFKKQKSWLTKRTDRESIFKVSLKFYKYLLQLAQDLLVRTKP